MSPARWAHLGRFRVRREWWEHHDFAKAVLRLCVPLRVEFLAYGDVFDIVAYGEAFEKTELGDEPRDYGLKVDLEWQPRESGVDIVPIMRGFLPGRFNEVVERRP